MIKNLLVAFALLVSAPAFSQSANLQAKFFASSARTSADVHTADLSNPGWRGVQIYIKTTAFTSGTYTPHIQGKDPVSGDYYDILVGAAISGTGNVTLTVYPGITATSNVSASTVLPQTWRLQMVGASTPSMTFSAGGFFQQ